MFDPADLAAPRLKARLREGAPLAAAWLALGSAALAEMAARARPDAIVLDLQHGLWERHAVEAAIGIAGAAVPVLVRVAENTPHAIGSALDAGAAGVIVPLVDNAEQAAQAVRAARYPPHGIRSGGGVRPLANFGRYVAAADTLVTIAMVETRAGVEQAAAIAATPGVDMVLIGSGDLALSLGVAAGHADFEAACGRVLAACTGAAVPCGIFTGSTQAALQRRREGYHMVVAAIDLEIAARGLHAGCSALRDEAA